LLTPFAWRCLGGRRLPEAASRRSPTPSRQPRHAMPANGPRRGAARGNTAFDAGRRAADAVRKKGWLVLSCPLWGKACASLEFSFQIKDLARFLHHRPSACREIGFQTPDSVAESRQDLEPD